MSNVKTKTNMVQRLHRPGEGHAIDMVRISGDPVGSTFSMDLSTAPVPPRQYPCDAVGIHADNFVVKLIFAQRRAVGPGWLSMLVLQIGYEWAERFVNATSGFEAALQAAQTGAGQGALTVFTEEAEQTVVLAASMGIAGFSGTEAAVDFYYASPFSIDKAQATSKLHVEPVVRIHLPGPLVAVMLRAMREAVASRNISGKVAQ